MRKKCAIVNSYYCLLPAKWDFEQLSNCRKCPRIFGEKPEVVLDLFEKLPNVQEYTLKPYIPQESGASGIYWKVLRGNEEVARGYSLADALYWLLDKEAAQS
ncbi:MAG: hypothetical protein ACPLTR_01955 [Thermacetogeniaceae bacterium]